ncbi:TM7S3/TM198-like domain-containing protein [Nocardioides pacificus]
MTDVSLGVLAILVGTLLCFRGGLLLRVVFPIWGAFAGFAFGAGLVAGFTDEHVLGSVTGWVLGTFFALVFAVLAYSYFAVSVMLVMASIGFTLGSGLVIALGIDWNWVAVLVGVVVGALLGVGALVADVPMLVLVLLSAAAGAVTIVTGFMLFTGALDSASFTDSDFTSRLDDDWWRYAAVVVLAIIGVLSQARDMAALRRSVHTTWTESRA